MYFQDLQVTGGNDLLWREDGQLTYLCNGEPVESGKPMESQRASENKEHVHIHTRIILQRLEICPWHLSEAEEGYLEWCGRHIICIFTDMICCRNSITLQKVAQPKVLEHVQPNKPALPKGCHWISGWPSGFLVKNFSVIGIFLKNFQFWWIW